MEFLKDILLIQQELIIKNIATKELTDDLEREDFIKKFNKSNHCNVKVVRNVKYNSYTCVRNKDILSMKGCTHNP